MKSKLAGLIKDQYPESESCTILQIGASDGYDFDPLYEYIYTSRCQAYLVEPAEASYSALQALHQKNPRVRCFNCTITDLSGTIEMTIAEPQLATR